MTKVNFQRMVVVLLITVSIASNTKAQSTSNKIVTGILKANQANNTARGANNTITDTKNTVTDIKNTIGGLIGKKKKKAQDGDGKDSVKLAQVTSIIISGIDYATLKVFEDSLQTIKGVASTKKNFTPASSTIDVSFSGESDELWDLIPARFMALFELKGLEANRISIELKKPS